MQIVSGLGTLWAVALIGYVMIHGYPGAVKRISLVLYRHARRVETIRARGAATVNESWIRELEGQGGH